jgi:hypothetical protein
MVATGHVHYFSSRTIIRVAVNESIGPAGYRVGPVWAPRCFRDSAEMGQHLFGEDMSLSTRPSAELEVSQQRGERVYEHESHRADFFVL